MRKYHQLLLVIITLTSLCTLLMYRHEYLKLRYVLEVLNFFGAPQGSIKDCLVLNETYVNDYKHRYMFSNPSPTWLKLGNHFVYSAFWELEDEKHHVRTLAVGPPTAFTNYECHIWFDRGEFLFSEMGKFGYSVKNIERNSEFKNSKTKIYELYCEPIENLVSGQPRGVIFIQKKAKTKFKIFVPVFDTTAENNGANQAGVCVKADMTGVSKSQILEFIGYHNVVGITDFIIYDTGLHNGIISYLQMLPGISGLSRTISALIWNFPFEDTDLQDVLMEMDCVARVSGKVEMVSLLNWDEYIIPKSSRNLYKMVQSVNVEKQTTEFGISTTICCIDMKDDKSADKSWPVALRKTRCMPLSERKTIIYNPKVVKEIKKDEIPRKVGEIFIYRGCSTLKKTVTKYEPVMAQFLGDLMTSKILRLRKSESFMTSR